MRIGIITILKVNNYGAELQAYATQAAIKKLGVDAEIIDYLFYKHPKHIKTTLSRPLFNFSCKKRLAEYLFPIISKIKEWGSKDTKLRRSRFEKFHDINTTQSRTFRTLDDLYSGCPDYDIYIVGSDQVWNPGIYTSLKPYFLDFAPKGKRKVAYASSFGIGKLPENVKGTYRNFLRSFDAIGAREKSGVKIISDLGLKAENVLDPTLLLNGDEWRKVNTQYNGLPERYVAVYELASSPYLRKVATEVSKSLGLPIVRICGSTKTDDKNAININDAGPAEFLSIIQNADFVVTDSFHGTAFSINFQKPFFTITPDRKDNNSRQADLLTMLGITNRILKENDPIPSAISLNFSKVNKLLEAERFKSINFLSTAIYGK